MKDNKNTSTTPPCVNCITLPICRSILGNKGNSKEFNLNNFNLKYVTILTKCSVVLNYIYNEKTFIPDRMRIVGTAILGHDLIQHYDKLKQGK
jgi:hypothetical protein